MNDLTMFTQAPARPVPVIILADASGSMSAYSKIDVLNAAIAEMISSFAQEDDTEIEIQVAVIAFGGTDARIHQPLEAASTITWQPLACDGPTPLGAALHLAREVVEDRTLIPPRAYAPTLILVSDGIPTDDWELPLKRLLESERASKAERFAIAIGDDADQSVLKEFIGRHGSELFRAHEAGQIKKFFRFMTMSVSMRTQGRPPAKTEADDLSFRF